MKNKLISAVLAAVIATGVFSSPVQAEDNYIIRNPEHQRYILHVDDLEEFEKFYNSIPLPALYQ